MRPTAIFLCLLLCVFACDTGVTVDGKVIQVTAKDRKLAKLQFIGLCAGCHGKYGRGDGPLAKNMVTKPRNWTNQTWQASVTDERLFKVIREGGAAVGLDALMAKNIQYYDNPAVILALVEMVRRFGH